VTATRRPTKRGRRRDPRLDDAVLAATRRLLTRVGYGALTIEAIAREAGLHRPAIYRRWRTKAEIVHDAVYAPDVAVPDFQPTGDFASELRAIARGAIALFSRRDVLAAVPGMMTDRQADPRLQRRLQPRMEAAARAAFADFIAAAVERGEANRPVDPDVLLDALAGAVLMRIATRGRRALDGLEDELTLLLQRATGARETRRRRS
jgi:AcrR family transcriptional regulator